MIQDADVLPCKGILKGGTDARLRRVSGVAMRKMRPCISQTARASCSVLGSVLAGSVVPAQAEAPMSYLHTVGPAADPVTRLNWGLLAISLAVVVIISILVLWATFRHRPPAQQRPDGRFSLETAQDGMPWITIGVGISTVVLLAAAAWTMVTLSTVAAPSAGATLRINVIAHQWWWEASYPSARQSEPAIVANEIHIPVGQPVLLQLESDDVIHSFWIPKLAGKTDMIPGQTNHAWLQANQAGDYRGQCGEYCGSQHAQMFMHVIAESPDAFAAWLHRQRQPSLPPADTQGLRGQQIFLARCGMCHTVNGSDAHGRAGPDLTHLMGRKTIAAGVLPNGVGELTRWVAHPQDVKPGVRMPVVELRLARAAACRFQRGVLLAAAEQIGQLFPHPDRSRIAKEALVPEQLAARCRIHRKTCCAGCAIRRR